MRAGSVVREWAEGAGERVEGGVAAGVREENAKRSGKEIHFRGGGVATSVAFRT